MSAFPRPPLSKIVFDKYDSDSSGTINSAEFKRMCYDLGHYLSDDELLLAMSRVDSSGNGQVAYDEFLNWWKLSDRFKNFKLTDEGKDMLCLASECFQFFDVDKSGTINKAEFDQVCGSLRANGFSLSEEQLLLHRIDKDGSGFVTFSEYVDWLVSVGALPVLDEASAENS